MSRVQKFWVSKCVDLYAVAQCLGGNMSGWQNVLSWECLGVEISCSHNVWMSKRGVSKCPGVEMLGAEMSENHSNCYFVLLYYPPTHHLGVLVQPTLPAAASAWQQSRRP